VKAYKVTLPCGRSFSYITDTPFAELAAAVKERFGCDAVEIKAL
jgi:hypothetical protein